MSTHIIYVAADDSKDSVTFAVQPGESPVCTEVKTLPNEPRKLRRFLETVARQGDLQICYEANGASFALHRQISSWGYHCDVAAPSLTPRRPGDRRKNDPRHADNETQTLDASFFTSVLVDPMPFPEPLPG